MTSHTDDVTPPSSTGPLEPTTSEGIECAGSFKYQHNTDTDLKNIHVFPKVIVQGGGGDEDEEDANEVGQTKGAILQSLRPSSSLLSWWM
jgi:hypothetical protein